MCGRYAKVGSEPTAANFFEVRVIVLETCDSLIDHLLAVEPGTLLLLLLCELDEPRIIAVACSMGSRQTAMGIFMVSFRQWGSGETKTTRSRAARRCGISGETKMVPSTRGTMSCPWSWWH